MRGNVLARGKVNLQLPMNAKYFCASRFLLSYMGERIPVIAKMSGMCYTLLRKYTRSEAYAVYPIPTLQYLPESKEMAG